MRNLKKMLSLVMALAMVASFMVAGASAAQFTDNDKVVNTEAVSMLVELGVIKGRDTGAFDPEGIVTRAEMAKMLCIIMNGGKDPNLSGGIGSFPDTKTHWAAGYIDYCKNLRIIVGNPDGNFYPDKTVTGTEAAKMVLMALGYDAVNEKFSNDANWETNINVAANVKGLFANVSGMPNAGLSRDNAAQMLYNGLNAKTVKYEMVGIINGNGVSQANDTNKTLLEDKFKAVKVEGVVIANEWANLESTSEKGGALDAGKTKITVTNTEDQTAFGGTVTFSTTTGLDMLGRSVVLYVATNSNSAKATVFGSATLSSDNTEYVDASSDSIVTVADDKGVNLTSATMVVANYGNKVNLKNYTDPKMAGVEKVLIDNDNDGDVEYVLMNTYNFGKVTSYTTTGDGSITVSAGSVAFSAKKSDTQGFEDVAKNDYVMAAYIGGKLVVTKAESVTGSLEAYKGSPVTTKLTVDGTTYNVSAVAGYTGGSDNIMAAKGYGSANLDNEATFYIDGNGYAVAVGDVAENAYNYALLMDKGSSNMDNRVKVALPDGTTGIYTLTTSGNGLKISQINPGTVYAYSINSSKEIKLTAATQDFDSAASKNATFTKGKTTITSAGNTAYANQNTVFFYTNATRSNAITGDTDVSVYTGYGKAPTLNSTAATVTVYKNGTRTVAVVFSGSSLTTANVSDNLYISSVGTSTTNYTNATAFVAGSSEAQSIKVDGSNSAAKGIYTYTINSDGYYELKSVPGANQKASTSSTQWGTYSANNNTIVIGNGVNFATGKVELGITDKTLLVDHSDYLDDPIAELGAGPDEGDKIAYVIYDLDNGKENNALLIVVKNDKNANVPELSTDVQVINSDKINFYANPTFYRENGTTIGAADKQIALSTAMKADGCKDIKFVGMTSMTYTDANGVGQATTFGTTAQVYKLTVDGLKSTYQANGATVTLTDASGVTGPAALTGANIKIEAGSSAATYQANGTYAMTAKDTVITTGYVKITNAANADNTGNTNKGVFSMTTNAVDNYAKVGTTVTITVKVETATTLTGATVSLGGNTITVVPATIDFTTSHAVGATQTATFDIASGATADITLTMSVADKT